VDRGVVVRNPGAPRRVGAVAKRTGALKRFLEERND